MGFYHGEAYADGDLSIGAPDVLATRSASKSANFDESMGAWLDRALANDHIMYFAVYLDGETIGQIFLHDIDGATHSALVGYHLFSRSSRGHGYGTCALGLLQRYVTEGTNLVRLCAITTRDNVASRRIGRKCSFVEIGPSREDPENGVVMEWLVERSSVS